jgi:hypothetical protein
LKNPLSGEFERANGGRTESAKIGGGCCTMMPFTHKSPTTIHANGAESGFSGAGVSEITDEAQAWLEGAGEMLKNVVTNRPVLALGTALAAGVFLGWLIKRR